MEDFMAYFYSMRFTQNKSKVILSVPFINLTVLILQFYVHRYLDILIDI